MNEFDFKEFFNYYMSKFILVFVLAVIGFIASLVYTNFMQTPLYSSHTSIILAKTNDNSSAITQSDISLNTNLISTYREIVKSRLILSQVIENLNLDIKESALAGMITVSSVENTELIDISVSNSNNTMACNIANEIAKVFKKEISNIYNIENVNIVDVAVISPTPYNIHPYKQYFFGTGLGFIIGSIILLIIFCFDDTITKREDIEETVELSLLGNIPLQKREFKHYGELVMAANPKSIISEQFRTLTTNLKFSSVDKKKKTFLITSSMPSEGKSFVSANLAIALAQTGAKVLLVDCDIRKGRQHHLFQENNRKGLSDLLVDENALENLNEYIVKDKAKNLSVLFRGSTPPNPSELLGSEKNKTIIKELKKKYDIIIFDSAPINGGLTDSLIMSNLVDGVIIVSAYKFTPVNVLKETKEQMQKVNANILGVVLNKSNTKNVNKYYGHYYG